jgi:hypothetical protein
MCITDHAAPLAPLLALGTPAVPEAEWLDYRAAFGLGPADIDALIAMACDRALLELEVDDPACWAPIHAWRALAGLRAEAAVLPLLALCATMAGNDWIDEELPSIFGLIGEPAVAPLRAWLCDDLRSEEGRILAADGIREIGCRHAGSRDACVSILTEALAPGAAAPPWVAGTIVSGLIDLKAVEAIEAIREAFARDAVEPFMSGDLEDVEIALGLRAERSTRRPHYARDYHARMAGWQDLISAGGDDVGTVLVPVRTAPKIGRNEACPCGSGKKYKKCCLGR